MMVEVRRLMYDEVSESDMALLLTFVRSPMKKKKTMLANCKTKGKDEKDNNYDRYKRQEIHTCLCGDGGTVS